MLYSGLDWKYSFHFLLTDFLSLYCEFYEHEMLCRNCCESVASGNNSVLIG